jgi:hypothetical protein
MSRWVLYTIAIYLVAFIARLLLSAFRNPKETFDRYKNLAEVLAIVSVGLVFTISFINGWQLSNMNISLDAKRFAISDEEDGIAVEVYLEKGENGSLRLSQGLVRAILPDKGNQIIGPQNLAGIDRLEMQGKQVMWDQAASELYRIAPKEKMQLAAILKVPHNEPCIIEAIVTGYQELQFPSFQAPSQWRSSTVSLPTQMKTK